jgi:hypothetical protein
MKNQMKTMTKQILAILAMQLAVIAVNQPLSAQSVLSTPAATDAEKEAFYAASVENRVADILKALNLTDAAKSNSVHDILIAQYHELRVRDAAIDTRLRVNGKDVNYANRAEELVVQSKPLHEQFLAKLGAVLSPEDIEKIKDLMTYNKVKVTYNAYCMIVPGLTDAEKGKIMDLLKAAREEAMDGGNAPEKSAIFQKYKEQINTYLDAQGHDTAKSIKEWAEKNPNTNSPVTK